MDFNTYRRHCDGSIDFDFYRAQAAALRRQAINDAFKLKAAFSFVLITLTLIVAVTAAASTTFDLYLAPSNFSKTKGQNHG